MATYFISDLHLTPDRKEVSRLFHKFLCDASLDAEAVYILGDLFEFWIGDDAIEVVGQSDAVVAIRELTRSGTPAYIIPGNRDFLVGTEFEESTGCRILSDPSRIDIDGKTTVLMHGDSMCTDDTAHQQFRTLVNDAQWQQEFLALPVDRRIELALNARTESNVHKSMSSMEIMDVNQGAVENEIRQHEAEFLIHGHTHRPGIHFVEVDGRRATRIVLGDWDEHNSVLRYESGTFRLSARGSSYPSVHLNGTTTPI